MTDTKEISVNQSVASMNSDQSVAIDMKPIANSIHTIENGGDEKKSNFKKYAENNSVGGLTFVLTGSSKVRRIVWLIILLVCVATSLFLLRNSVGKLINKPTSTTINIKPNEKLELPAFTICNENWFFYSSVESVYDGDEEGIRTLSEHIYNRNCSATYSNASLENKLKHTPIAKLTDVDSEIDFIQLCVIEGIECTAEDFEITLSEYGVCYTLNSRKHIPATSTGTIDLELRVDIKTFDYFYTPSTSVGITVSIHPQGQRPLALTQGISVAPGTTAKITFKKRITEDRTKTNCNESTPLVNCFNDVYYETLRTCECFANVTDIDSLERAFSTCPITDLCCFLARPNTSAAVFERFEKCLPQCRTVQFEIVTTSYSKFPPPQFSDNETELEALAFNQVQLQITYNTLNVETQITDYSYGVEEFLAEVGGQLGLCIGVSVISLFELIIFILDEMKDRFFRPLYSWTKKKLKKMDVYTHIKLGKVV